MNIDYTIQIWKEDQDYIAHAMPLDVMSAGTTPEEAKAALREAVHLFIETAREMGTWEDIMDECGYRRIENNWISPAWIAVERHEMAIGY